jgi:hypothetical protein
MYLGQEHNLAAGWLVVFIFFYFLFFIPIPISVPIESTSLKDTTI